MDTLTRREILLMSAGFSIMAGCGSSSALAPARGTPGMQTSDAAGAATNVLDEYVKRFCAQAQYATTALYDNGKTALRGYANGVPDASVDTSWIFGIGSNTKVFTSTILAYECGGSSPSRSLTDPVADFLPDPVRKDGKAIKDVTLVDLATHTSSFPRTAPVENVNTLFFDKPPTAAQTDWWVDWTNTGSPNKESHCIGKTPGTCYSYSDSGFITLGFAVSDSNEVPGKKYTQLLADYVTEPLGLTSTGAHEILSVKGHLKNGIISPTLPTDLRSNAPDLLRFLEASLGTLSGVSPELQAALYLTQQVHWEGAKYGDPDTNVGLAWQLPVRPGKPQLIWKNGEAGGFTSFMGMVPSKSFAVAILTNSDAANPTTAGLQFLSAMCD